MKGMRKALIVEKSTELRQCLSDLFEGHQFKVAGASSVEGIISLLEYGSVDLILVNWTDAWMPSRQLLRAICASNFDTVIVVAGLAGNLQLALELLRAGATECLTKPVALAELVVAAEEALKRHFLGTRPWYDQSVMAIAAAIGLRDVETEEHCRRVANTTVRLCRLLGVTAESRLQAIEWGAYLHDVGKVGIPDRILHKNGSLTLEEQEEMRRHPEIGSALLSRIPFLSESIPVVLHHHERYDGAGYPAGLSGDLIPLEARAIALADTVDAMLSNRPYRRAQPWQVVVRELCRSSGTQFDPLVVDAALGHQDEVFRDYLIFPYAYEEVLK